MSKIQTLSPVKVVDAGSIDQIRPQSEFPFKTRKGTTSPIWAGREFRPLCHFAMDRCGTVSARHGDPCTSLRAPIRELNP